MACIKLTIEKTLTEQRSVKLALHKKLKFTIHFCVLNMFACCRDRRRFCTDRSLGMGVHVVPGKSSKRWDPKYSNLDDPRQPGDFPQWFQHYKKAAEETKHGILILQLTEAYFR